MRIPPPFLSHSPFPLLLSFLLLLVIVPSTTSITIPTNFTSRLDSFVRCMLTYPPPNQRPPELILSIVANSEILFAQGYGCNRTGHAISNRTLIGIGSVSKAFTSTLMGRMLDAHQLHYDMHITDYPQSMFHTYSPYIDVHATLRDLLTHQTGISRADFIAFAYNGTAPWQSFVSHLTPHLPPTVDFRQYYRYNNYMVAEAALILEQVDGTLKWEAMMQQLFDALEMVDSTTSAVAARLSGRMATPYIPGAAVNDTPVVLPIDANDWVDHVRPAGSVFSTALDMAAWMNAHLGHYPSYLSQPVLNLLHTPQVEMDPPPPMAFLPNDPYGYSSATLGYSFGWFEVAVDGHRLSTHPGSTLSFASDLQIWPGDDFGVFISGPAVSGLVLNVILSWIDFELLGVDNFIGRMYCNPRGEAGEATEEDRRKAKELMEAMEERRTHETDPLLPLPLRTNPPASYTALKAAAASAPLSPDQLSGRYHNTRGGAWGEMVVSTTGNETWPLQVVWTGLIGMLQPNMTAGEGYWNMIALTPQWMGVLFGVLPVIFFNTSRDEVYGVYALVDDPIPYFILESSTVSSTGVGPSQFASSSTGAGDAVESRANTVLLTIALSVVSLLLLVVVMYAVFVTKRWKDLQGTQRPRALSEHLI